MASSSQPFDAKTNNILLASPSHTGERDSVTSPDPRQTHSSSSSTVSHGTQQDDGFSPDVEKQVDSEKTVHEHGLPPPLTSESGNAGATDPATPTPAKPPMNPMDPSLFPDGGAAAWKTVLGAACALFVSFGWINAIGIFQDYYQRTYLSEYSPATVAWIPSMEAFMMFFGGAWVGRVYDNYGPRWLLLAGLFFHVFGLMMASLSTQYYQFMLSQGICSPIGAAMLFYPAINATITWFYKGRALALGIVVAGSSLGGVIFPIMVDNLLPEVGFPWTMRICALLILFLATIANLFVRSRIPPRPRPVRVMDFISPFKELPFALLVVGSFIVFLGLFLPFTFIILAADTRGCDPKIAKYLVSILNAASIFGRILPGWAADKLGRFSMFVAVNILTAIIILAVWLPTSGTGASIVFAVLFGFSSGSVISLAPSLIAQISDVREIGTRSGSLYVVIGTAVLIGSPIGGAIIDAYGGRYQMMQLYAGLCMLLGSVFYVALRVKLGGWNWLNKT